MSKKPSTRVQLARYAYLGQVVGNSLSLFIRWGFGALMVYFLTDALKILAGKTTKMELIASVLSNIYARDIVFALLGLGGLLYGKQQSRIRKRRVKELTDRLRQHESSIDPGRTSSGLLPSGNTRPEDIE